MARRDITMPTARIQLCRIPHVGLDVVSLHHEIMSSLYVLMIYVGGRRESDLVFIQDRGVWACCTSDNGTIDCNNPSIEVYPGPATADLATIQYVPATGTPTYPAPTGTATSTSNTTVTQTSSSSSGVSPGAAAGIGVGVGAGVALAAFMIAFLFM